MPDRALQEQISAYADGELDPIEVRQVEAALASQPELRAFLTRSRALDKRARKTLLKQTPKLDSTAAEVTWKTVLARLPAESNTTLQGASESAEFWREKAAGLKDIPLVEDKQWDALWSNVKQQTALVKPERRQEMRTPVTLLSADSGAMAVPGNFKHNADHSRRWAYWTLSVSVAAMALLMVGLAWLKVMGPAQPGQLPGPSINVAASEVLDSKYFMLVKNNVPGVDAPVVCFYLNDEEPEKDLFE